MSQSVNQRNILAGSNSSVIHNLQKRDTKSAKDNLHRKASSEGKVNLKSVVKKTTSLKENSSNVANSVISDARLRRRQAKNALKEVRRKNSEFVLGAKRALALVQESSDSLKSGITEKDKNNKRAVKVLIENIENMTKSTRCLSVKNISNRSKKLALYANEAKQELLSNLIKTRGNLSMLSSKLNSSSRSGNVKEEIVEIGNNTLYIEKQARLLYNIFNVMNNPKSPESIRKARMLLVIFYLLGNVSNPASFLNHAFKGRILGNIEELDTGFIVKKMEEAGYFFVSLQKYFKPTSSNYKADLKTAERIERRKIEAIEVFAAEDMDGETGFSCIDFSEWLKGTCEDALKCLEVLKKDNKKNATGVFVSQRNLNYTPSEESYEHEKEQREEQKVQKESKKEEVRIDPQHHLSEDESLSLEIVESYEKQLSLVDSDETPLSPMSASGDSSPLDHRLSTINEENTLKMREQDLLSHRSPEVHPLSHKSVDNFDPMYDEVYESASGLLVVEERRVHQEKQSVSLPAAPAALNKIVSLIADLELEIDRSDQGMVENDYESIRSDSIDIAVFLGEDSHSLGNLPLERLPVSEALDIASSSGLEVEDLPDLVDKRLDSQGRRINYKDTESAGSMDSDHFNQRLKRVKKTGLLFAVKALSDINSMDNENRRIVRYRGKCIEEFKSKIENALRERTSLGICRKISDIINEMLKSKATSGESKKNLEDRDGVLHDIRLKVNKSFMSMLFDVFFEFEMQSENLYRDKKNKKIYDVYFENKERDILAGIRQRFEERTKEIAYSTKLHVLSSRARKILGILNTVNFSKEKFSRAIEMLKAKLHIHYSEVKEVQGKVHRSIIDKIDKIDGPYAVSLAKNIAVVAGSGLEKMKEVIEEIVNLQKKRNALMFNAEEIIRALVTDKGGKKTVDLLKLEDRKVSTLLDGKGRVDRLNRVFKTFMHEVVSDLRFVRVKCFFNDVVEKNKALREKLGFNRHLLSLLDPEGMVYTTSFIVKKYLKESREDSMEVLKNLHILKERLNLLLQRKTCSNNAEKRKERIKKRSIDPILNLIHLLDACIGLIEKDGEKSRKEVEKIFTTILDKVEKTFSDESLNDDQKKKAAEEILDNFCNTVRLNGAQDMRVKSQWNRFSEACEDLAEKVPSLDLLEYYSSLENEKKEGVVIYERSLKDVQDIELVRKELAPLRSIFIDELDSGKRREIMKKIIENRRDFSVSPSDSWILRYGLDEFKDLDKKLENIGTQGPLLRRALIDLNDGIEALGHISLLG